MSATLVIHPHFPTGLTIELVDGQIEIRFDGGVLYTDIREAQKLRDKLIELL